ncbi:amino acid permease [uncultured Jatrophihabitans sp.]|uniref:amino acid permease n=1 Tax=uncultured Jatrophihabitans sp. TaxID=1610747 RepID=UPI0035CC60CB
MGRPNTTPSAPELPESTPYRLKRLLLGRPLVNASLHDEKLSKKSALGVLSSDCISSSAYGSEEMLIVLLPIFGLTGFGLLMPLTGVVLALLVLTTLSYRQVVRIYTKAGGSYVVARENFGPKVAQIASVALLIDYIVTVAVQTAAGTAAITSLVPPLAPYALEISLCVVGLLAYGNLRGVREAGKAFALPTYFFVFSAGPVVVVGLLREVFGDLPTIGYSAHVRARDLVDVHDNHHALLTFAAVYVLMKAFANGGASLTGLEAISNGVSAFKPDAGRNARRTLSAMSVILGCLVLGVSFLAWQTHATPYTSGSPTVISQVAHAAFGHSWYGNAGFVVVQIATALILYTGANTPFTGFPFLASFIAEDSFLPRQLMRRGHRLAFSTGILVLTLMAVSLLLGVGAHVDKLLPFYAIGVFTGFTMAGLGMAKYHRTHRERGWRRKAAVNATSGVVSAAVVVIFAVVKFDEGAWLVVLLFPIGWIVLMRLNQRYRAEARSLDLATWVRADLKKQEQAAYYGRHTIVVLVDRLDLAVLRALRYAGSLRPTELRVVHVAMDSAESAHLQQQWIERDLGDRYPLTVVDCPDRRLVRAITELAYDTVIGERAEVTLLLPRRSFRTLSQRLLHDRTADRIAEAVARLPHVAATIVPFDTTLPHEVMERLEHRQTEAAREPSLPVPLSLGEQAVREPRREGVTAIGAARWRQRLTIEGRVTSVQLGAAAGRSLEVQVCDETGGLRLLFMGRTSIAGITPGCVVRATGRVGEYRGHLAIANPEYELLVPA